MDAIEPDRALPVQFEGRELLVFRLDESVAVVSAICPHQGSRLSAGLIAGCLAVCPSHGWAFDVRTGRCRGVRSAAITVFPVRIVDGVVHLQLSTAAALRDWLRRMRRGRVDRQRDEGSR